MIVPMTRYGFLLYHADAPGFLERLRELGMVDITTSSWAGNEQERELLAQSERLKTIAKAMRSVEPQGEPIVDVQQAAQQWEQATAAIEAANVAIAKAQKESIEAQLWGDFDPAKLAELKQQGIMMRFFEVSNKNYKPQWEQDYAIDVVAQDAVYTYFVLVQQGQAVPVDIAATEVRAPSYTSAEKDAQVERLLAQQVENQTLRAQAAHSMEAVRALSIDFQERFDFSQVMNAGQEYAEGTVKILEGWSEAQNTKQIEAFAQAEQVVFTSEKAKVEQNPPIKLKNNFFARLYEPIGELYMLPRYDEIDMTPFFAPFFMVFFGMCLGDAGYGLLYVAAILFMWKRVPVKFKGFLWLGLFLSISGIIFGMLSGNMFGIELFKVEAFAKLRSFMLLRDPNTVFFFAIALGAVQVLFGQILRIFNRIKRGGSFVYGLSSLGWVMLFLSSIAAFGIMEIYPEYAAIYGTGSLYYYITLGVAGFLILFFANPKKNPLMNIGLGVYSAYEMATGVVGDLISYVRLFAIGLAGAIIAQVFNELAMGLSGDIIVVKQLVMVIILLIGHGLNIFLSSLSAFVHPLRLTFVEFYKNAEFEGGGRAFKPFKRKN